MALVSVPLLVSGLGNVMTARWRCCVWAWVGIGLNCTRTVFGKECNLITRHTDYNLR